MADMEWVFRPGVIVAALSVCVAAAPATQPGSTAPVPATRPAPAAAQATSKPTTEPATRPDPRIAVPDPTSRAKAAKLIAELFQTELSQIRNTAQEAEYAAKLLKAGTETADDPVGRFELFEEARSAAAQSGDIETAMQAVAQISQDYRVNGLALAAHTLGGVVNHLSPQVAPKALPFIDSFVSQAIGADRLDLARLGAELAMETARTSKDGTLIAQAAGFSKEIESLAGAYAGVPAAAAKLEHHPSDPDANLIVGRYYCLYKGEWGALQPLSRCSDPVLKGIAARDLAGATDAHGMMLIGDGWWDWAEAQTGAPRQNARDRAVFWYQKASPQLEGLSKLVVDHRLFEMQSEQVQSERPAAVRSQ